MSPEPYARALSKLLEEGMKPEKAVAAIRDALAKSGREALLPRVGRAFARLYARESAKNALVVSVAREKDAKTAERAAKDALKELGVEAADVEVRIDDSLIGGWRLEGKERLIDRSFKKELLSIYNRATQ